MLNFQGFDVTLYNSQSLFNLYCVILPFVLGLTSIEPASNCHCLLYKETIWNSRSSTSARYHRKQTFQSTIHATHATWQHTIHAVKLLVQGQYLSKFPKINYGLSDLKEWFWLGSVNAIACMQVQHCFQRLTGANDT